MSGNRLGEKVEVELAEPAPLCKEPMCVVAGSTPFSKMLHRWMTPRVTLLIEHWGSQSKARTGSARSSSYFGQLLGQPLTRVRTGVAPVRLNLGPAGQRQAEEGEARGH